MKSQQILILKHAIILEDARRLKEGIEPINNIRRLAIELCDTYPETYTDFDVLYKTIWRSSKKAYNPHHGLFNSREKLIDHLCEVLHTNREELVIEREL